MRCQCSVSVHQRFLSRHAGSSQQDHASIEGFEPAEGAKLDQLRTHPNFALLLVYQRCFPRGDNFPISDNFSTKPCNLLSIFTNSSSALTLGRNAPRELVGASRQLTQRKGLQNNGLASQSDSDLTRPAQSLRFADLPHVVAFR